MLIKCMYELNSFFDLVNSDIKIKQSVNFYYSFNTKSLKQVILRESI